MDINEAKTFLRAVLAKSGKADQMPATLDKDVTEILADETLVNGVVEFNLPPELLYSNNNKWVSERAILKASLENPKFIQVVRDFKLPTNILFHSEAHNDRKRCKELSQDDKFTEAVKEFKLDNQILYNSNWSHSQTLLRSSVQDEKFMRAVRELRFKPDILVEEYKGERVLLKALSQTPIIEKLISTGIRFSSTSSCEIQLKRLLNYPEVFEGLETGLQIKEVLTLKEPEFSKLAASAISGEVEQTVAALSGAKSQKAVAA